jgi:hypothetical protein
MKTTNPILEELWRIKDQLAAESGNDMQRYCEQLRAWSAAHPHTGRVLHNAEEVRQWMEEEDRKLAERPAAAASQNHPLPGKS